MKYRFKKFKQLLIQLNNELTNIEQKIYSNNMKLYNKMTIIERVDVEDLRYYLEDLNNVIERIKKN